jgi:hypothetical protein
MDEWALRQAKTLAEKTNLEVPEVITVLESFKGLFRASPKTTKGEPFYSLHLRHIRQNADDKTSERPPLETEHLFELLKFVGQQANEEARRGLTITTTLIASSLSLFASVIVLIISVLRSH